MTRTTTETTATHPEVSPFSIDVPEEKLLDLRRRINATQWPEKETVADESQGLQLATMQELARYWATDYDWRKVEAKLQALPQFTTEIDGLDIHFIHVRSEHENALPLIVNHGWLYWEYKGGFWDAKGVSIPVAVSVFPGEAYQAPRSWTERAYPNLIHFNEVDRGGHFAAWEEPELFSEEVRAAFRSLR